MRALILASMATLVLSGLPPAPLAPLPAQPAQPAARASEDPDSICAPFIQGLGYRDEEYGGYGRNQRAGGTSARLQNAPPPPPPPPSPPPPPPHSAADASAAEQSVAVTGQRVRQPSLTATSPVTVVGGQDARRNDRSASQGALRTAPTSPQGYPQPIPGVDANRERYAGEAVAAVQAVADAPVSTFSDRRRHRQLFQRPPAAERRPDAAAGGGADRGDAQLFPLRLSAAAGPVAAVQHHHRHDDDAVEREHAAAARRPARLRSAARRAGRRPTSSSWSTCRDRWTSPDKLPLVQCSLALLADRLNPRDRVSIVVYAGAAGLVLRRPRTAAR